MNQSPAPSQTDEVDRLLAGQSDISQLYRSIPAEAPPERLTAAVRAMARQAASRRTPGIWQRVTHWLDQSYHRFRVPMAAFASGVLVVTVSLNVLHEHGEDILHAPGFDQPVRQIPPTVDSPSAPEKPSASAPITRPSAQAPAIAPSRPPAPAQPRLGSEDLQVKALPFDLGQLTAPLTPAEWLADIRVLVKAGKTDEAREELQAFAKAHPREPLPEDLRHLLSSLPAPPAAAITP